MNTPGQKVVILQEVVANGGSTVLKLFEKQSSFANSYLREGLLVIKK